MKQLKLIALLSVIFYACQAKKDKDAGEIRQETGGQGDTTRSNVVYNTSFKDADKERFLRLELTIDTSVEAIWNAFSTVEGIKSWMVPVTEMDFRVGGWMKNHMNYKAKIGDFGTINLGIVNYVPKEMLTYKVNLDTYFGEKCRKEDKNLQEVILFKPLGKNRTKIVSNMIGWGSGKEWDSAYAFFEKGNKWAYDVMIKRFKEGPIDWPRDP